MRLRKEPAKDLSKGDVGPGRCRRRPWPRSPKTETGKGTYRKSKPKSDASQRTIALPPFAVDVLTRRRVEQSANRYDAVFATRDGTWHQVGNIERRWRAIRADTGFDWVTPHTFHKTVATMIDRLVGSDTAARVLGDSSDVITKEFYIAKDRSTPDVTHLLQSFAGSATTTTSQGLTSPRRALGGLAAPCPRKPGRNTSYHDGPSVSKRVIGRSGSKSN